MRGSLVHDVLYRFIYHELLSYSCKVETDNILVQITAEDGMSKLRCKWVHRGVKIGGDPRPSKIKPILTAP